MTWYRRVLAFRRPSRRFPYMLNMHDYWFRLVQAIQQEVRGHNQDPNLLEVDESASKVRLPLDATTWHSERFRAEDLVNGDPAALARRFYEGYRAAAEDERQNPA